MTSPYPRKTRLRGKAEGDQAANQPPRGIDATLGRMASAAWIAVVTVVVALPGGDERKKGDISRALPSVEALHPKAL